MARNAASTPYLEGLTRNETMPQPLGEWVRAELEFGVHGTLNRLALAAALEGCAGIPAAHRETKGDPADRALWLAGSALESLHHWWKKDHRAALLDACRVAATKGQTAGLLRCWCTWRATERAKRYEQEYARQVQPQAA